MESLISPLRIAVVGAGNIGSTFAFHLARAGGHEVTVVARPGSSRLAQLRRDGAIVDDGGQRAHVQVVDALDESTPYDLVIVTVLTHQVDAVLPALGRSAARSIQFMFNTFGPERLGAAVGDERSAFGMPFVQATLDRGGRLKARIGAVGQKTLMSDQRWVDVFNAAGLPAVRERDMPLWLRCHVPLCVAFESVSVAGVRRGGGASWREARILACGVRASFKLIEAMGHLVYPRAKRLIYRSPLGVVATMLWSMSRVRSFRELLASGRAECVALVQAMETEASLARRGDLVEAVRAMAPS